MINKAFLLSCMLALAALAGCKKDNEKGPSDPGAVINLGEIGTTIKVLETIDFTLEAAIPAGIKSGLSIIWLDDQELQRVYESGVDSLTTSIAESHSFTIEPEYAGKNLTFTFSVTDLLDRVAGDTISLSIEESAIQLISNKNVLGYNNLSTGSFIDVVKDTVYFGSNVKNSTTLKKSIDLVCFFTTADKRVLAAPSNDFSENVWKEQSSALWPLFGVENATSLYLLGTGVDYNSIITSEQIENVFTGQSNPVDSITNIVVDQLIGFQLASARGDKKGIILIKSVEGNSPSTGGLTFDAKIQK